MKPARLLIALLLATAALPASAKDAPPALPEWDQLEPAQREQLIAPLRDRWNADPGQRGKLLDRARRWQQLTPEERRHAHRGLDRWKHMSPEQREEAKALYARMRQLDDRGRAALKRQWKAMDPEQRKAWAEANRPPGDGTD